MLNNFVQYKEFCLYIQQVMNEIGTEIMTKVAVSK